jgi:hypothetical protein
MRSEMSVCRSVVHANRMSCGNLKVSCSSRKGSVAQIADYLPTLQTGGLGVYIDLEDSPVNDDGVLMGIRGHSGNASLRPSPEEANKRKRKGVSVSCLVTSISDTSLNEVLNPLLLWGMECELIEASTLFRATCNRGLYTRSAELSGETCECFCFISLTIPYVC